MRLCGTILFCTQTVISNPCGAAVPVHIKLYKLFAKGQIVPVQVSRLIVSGRDAVHQVVDKVHLQAQGSCLDCPKIADVATMYDAYSWRASGACS